MFSHWCISLLHVSLPDENLDLTLSAVVRCNSEAGRELGRASMSMLDRMPWSPCKYHPKLQDRRRACQSAEGAIPVPHAGDNTI